MMTINKLTKIAGIGLLLTGLTALNAEAGDNSSLLEKLVEKGVITQAEANALLLEESNGGNNDKVPSWVSRLTLKGDLRLRFEHTHDGEPSDVPSAEDRWRYRFRLGGIANLENGFKVGFRFATGDSGQAVSSNQTFGGDFGRDKFNLDQAYAAWKQDQDWGSTSGLTMYGGKMPNFANTGWKISGALFDSDITPEGIEVHYGGLETGLTTLGFHGGAYLMEGEDDPSKQYSTMIMAQVTSQTKLSDTLAMDLGVGLYGINSNDLAGQGNGKGNTAGQGYTPLMIDLAFSYKAAIPIKAYGTWVDNQQADSMENGWITGIKFGNAKKAGDWQAKVEYVSLEKDAIWDELADDQGGAFGIDSTSTGYGTGTNFEGVIFQGKYNLYDNVQTALSLWFTESEDGASSSDDNTRLQADLIFKF